MSNATLSSVFGHRFVILDTDEYVLKYMESNASQYSPEALASIKNRIQKQDVQEAPAPESEKYVGLPRVGIRHMQAI